MEDLLLTRLRRFHTDTFPEHRLRFQDLVEHGQTRARCSSAALIRAWCPTC